MMDKINTQVSIGLQEKNDSKSLFSTFLLKEMRVKSEIRPNNEKDQFMTDFFKDDIDAIIPIQS